MEIYDRKYLKHEIKKLAGKEVVVKIMQRDDTRTLPQNRYLHGGVLRPLADHHYGPTNEDLQKMKVDMVKKFGVKMEYINFRGDPEEDYKSTTAYTKKEMMDFIESIRQWSLNYDGFYIMSAEEYKYGYGDME